MTTNRYAFEAGVYGDALDLDALIRALADSLYPGVLYDAALPQGWVDGCLACGYDPRAQWVWGYPVDGPEGGVPLPLIREARDNIPVAMLDPDTLYPWRDLVQDTVSISRSLAAFEDRYIDTDRRTT